jgi:hypothetical protein
MTHYRAILKQGNRTVFGRGIESQDLQEKAGGV